jgi:hypothetical protein
MTSELVQSGDEARHVVPRSAPSVICAVPERPRSACWPSRAFGQAGGLVSRAATTSALTPQAIHRREWTCDAGRMAQTVCPLVPAEDRARLEAIIADRNRAQKHVGAGSDHPGLGRSPDRRRGRQACPRRPAGGLALATPLRRSRRVDCGTPPANRARRRWATRRCVGSWF